MSSVTIYFRALVDCYSIFACRASSTLASLFIPNSDLCCSSKPTGGAGGSSFGSDNASRSGHGNYKSITVPSDWMCTICGCVNFARRTSCFQVYLILFISLNYILQTLLVLDECSVLHTVDMVA